MRHPATSPLEPLPAAILAALWLLAFVGLGLVRLAVGPIGGVWYIGGSDR